MLEIIGLSILAIITVECTRNVCSDVFIIALSFYDEVSRLFGTHGKLGVFWFIQKLNTKSRIKFALFQTLFFKSNYAKLVDSE